jgi:hypothetical protein
VFHWEREPDRRGAQVCERARVHLSLYDLLAIVCVCARARARVCVCVCVCARARVCVFV